MFAKTAQILSILASARRIFLSPSSTTTLTKTTRGISLNRHKDYGEIGNGILKGDRSATTPMREGYVYVFTKDGSLKIAFEVKAERYRKVSVSESDGSHKTTKGPARAYMVIKNFFTSDDAWAEDHYVVASAIILSKERLFTSKVAAIKMDPTKRGKNIAISKSRLRDTQKDTRSGPQILKDSRQGKSSPDLWRYDFQYAKIAGREGFHLLIPDVPRELRRRNQVFRTRLARYHKWLHESTRVKEAFLFRAVDSIIRQDKKFSSYLNKSRFDQWKKNDIEQYRERFFPVYYAIRNLIHWLESREVAEVLRDYSLGDDSNQQDGIGIYHDGIKDIFYTERGSKHLAKEYNDKDSYLAQSTRLLALKPQYVDRELFSNSYVEIRKWNNVVFGFLEEIAPVIIATERQASLAMIANFIKLKTGTVIEKIRIQPSTLVATTVEVADVDKFLKKAGSIPNTKGGKSVIAFIEGANVALAVYGLARSEDGMEVAKGTVNLVGAALDFGSSNWLVSRALRNKLGPLTGSKFVTGMIFVSGVIDCILGVWGAIDAWREGEFDVFVGWGIFAFGGAIVAAGAAATMFGGKVAVGSGGTLAKFGGAIIVGGLIIEGVGLAVVALCNNDEIEEWLVDCMFGTKPGSKSTSQQIQMLNDILCKFEVEASFKDTEMKFTNYTRVTLKIVPRVLTDNSRIQFSGLQAYAESRWAEILQSRQHHVVGQSGSKNPLLDLSNPTNCTISRDENGRITKVETKLHYKIDIDEVKGYAEVKINNGTLQGYKRKFSVTA